jgi:ankyrin repeat protein
MKTNMLRLSASLILIVVGSISQSFAGKPEKMLYEGITKSNIDKVKQAIDEGADVNKKVSMKLPILWALETSHRVDIIKLLIDKGADVNASDIKGSVLYQYGGFVETPENKAKWLNDFYKKYKVDTTVTASQFSTITEVTHLLLDAGAKPDYDMGTILGNVLQSSMTYGIGSEDARAEFIKALITHKTNKADPNDRMRTTGSVTQNTEGFKMVDKDKHPTPLMYAAQKGMTKIALALIEGGADLNITMNVYKSSSDMWASYNSKTTVTALDIARAKGYKEIEEKLIAAGAH